MRDKRHTISSKSHDVCTLYALVFMVPTEHDPVGISERGMTGLQAIKNFKRYG